MRIEPGSGGSFLCPPGHPNHFHHIEAGLRRDPSMMASLDYALKDEYDDVPEHIKARVQALFDQAELRCSELWQQHVYGYFKNCYSRDGVDRSVASAKIYRNPLVTPPAVQHLAYLAVKEYFPDADPRLDLIESHGFYGTKLCLGCGIRLQYEASVDCFAEAINCNTKCPNGTDHHVEG